MRSLVVVIPVLGRPHRVGPVYESAIKASPHDATILFIPTPGDHPELAAIREVGADHLEAPAHWRLGDFARKTNFAIRSTDHEFIFSAADDLEFEHGWFDEAVQLFDVEGVGVVGTNDMGHERVRRGEHATHNLVSRAYVNAYGTIDQGGRMYHEGYSHSFCDDELVQTARSRGAWVFAEKAVVRHLHPDFGTAPKDKTYEMGRRNFYRDRMLFHSRKRFWS